eukprot:2349641-Pleurochrysis_carterae.AAC.3
MAAASVWKTAVLSRGCRPSSVAAQRSVTRMGVRLLQHSSRALRGSSSKDDEEREAYLNRLESIGLETMEEPWELIDTLKLGRRQSTYNNKSSSMRRYHVCNAYWVASILDPKDKIPDLTPLRPEVNGIAHSKIELRMHGCCSRHRHSPQLMIDLAAYVGSDRRQVQLWQIEPAQCDEWRQASSGHRWDERAARMDEVTAHG